MTFIQTNFPAISTPQGLADRLLVLGKIDSTGQVELEPLFVIPNVVNIEPNLPGPYALVLRNGDGNELARYPFTPDQPPAKGSESVLSISELVPYVNCMEQLDVEGSGGELLTSITAGAAPPTVTILESNQNQPSTTESVTVNWTASDSDDDPLTFCRRIQP